MARILISIDHKWRDLPGYVYAALQLEAIGHQVYFTRNGFEPYYVVGVRPDLVIIGHLLDPQRQKFATELSDQGVLVVLMPTEGIPTLEGYRKYSAGYDNDLSGVALHLVWNQPMADILYDNRSISRDKVRVVGCPRFDFYRLPLLNSLPTKEQFCRERQWQVKRPIVTFATNFTQAQFHERNQNFQKIDAARLGYREVVEQLAGSLEDMSRKDYESREILVNAFVRLVAELEEVNFIIKLHPSEDHIYYFDLLRDRLKNFSDRVCIVTRAYIWDVLSITDVELKRSCTTGVESWMLGKPTIEMKLNPTEWYFSPEHASGSYIATNYDDLREMTVSYLHGDPVAEDLVNKRFDFINRWCFAVDGARTQALVGEVDMLLKQAHRPRKIRFSLTRWLTWLALTLTDYRLHDAKVYGVFQMFSKSRIDKLGRIDKYFNASDVSRLRTRLSAVIAK